MSGEKRWMMSCMAGPVPIEIIYEVPREVADGTAPPGAYEMKIVDLIVPPCPDCGERRCKCFRETCDG